MKEAITKAKHDSEFVCDTLKEALDKADPTESIILLDLIAQANKLRQKIKRLYSAKTGLYD